MLRHLSLQKNSASASEHLNESTSCRCVPLRTRLDQRRLPTNIKATGVSRACLAASLNSQSAVFAPPTMMMLFSPASQLAAS